MIGVTHTFKSVLVNLFLQIHVSLCDHANGDWFNDCDFSYNAWSLIVNGINIKQASAKILFSCTHPSHFQNNCEKNLKFSWLKWNNDLVLEVYSSLYSLVLINMNLQNYTVTANDHNVINQSCYFQPIRCSKSCQKNSEPVADFLPRFLTIYLRSKSPPKTRSLV